MGHGPDDVGTGHEHVGGVLHHDVEVGDGGAVDGAARAGAEDGGDLRHHPRGQGVAQEDVGVAAEGGDALLDARAAGVVEADDRRAHLHREVHDLADLLGVGLGEAAAEDREVLGEDVDETPVDAAVAGDDAVARDLLLGHAEVEAAVLDQLVELLEGALVEEELDALAGGELAFPVLALAPLGATPLLGSPDLVAEDVQSLRHGAGAGGRAPEPPRGPATTDASLRCGRRTLAAGRDTALSGDSRSRRVRSSRPLPARSRSRGR